MQSNSCITFRDSATGNIFAIPVDISKKQMPMDVPASSKEKEKKQTLQFSKAGYISRTAEKQ